MSPYAMPQVFTRPALTPTTAWLVSSGDLREAANASGWPIQHQMEAALIHAVGSFGWRIQRANPIDPETGHGFITSQKMGMEVFKNIPVDAPLIVAEAIWQYSHHVLHGLRSHQGPIITIANFAGDAPGLVGLLGLNAGLRKMGTPYSTLWSVDFTDEWFLSRLNTWLTDGVVVHDLSHVRPLIVAPQGSPEADLGRALAAELTADKAIFGVFDEGCMGMYNAIIDDEIMNKTGIYKERLSQSALWAEMLTVSHQDADSVGSWLEEKGMRFILGDDESKELTSNQLRWQYKMYIAALRIADDFGLDVVGIQYQQGLKDICPASDLVEGLLNNVDRPPVTNRQGSRVLYEGRALPVANESDEGVAIDALVTNRLWSAMGYDPATTLHDVRWGDMFEGEFVWVFEISGSVPASHFATGYREAEGWRQNPMYFPLGGSTLRGVSKPGSIVWSRVFVENNRLHVDMGLGRALELPEEETKRRWDNTNPEWPIMHAVLEGVDRDALMCRHPSNHVQVAYCPDAHAARQALTAKASLFHALGLSVNIVGDATLVG